MRIPRVLPVLGLVAAVVASVQVAEAQTTGVISGAGRSLKVVDAFAYDAVGQFGDPVLKIRLSDRALDRKALATVIDVAFELDAQRGNANYFDLLVDRKTGAYAGSSYDLGGGVSCAFCMEPAVFEGSKLRIEAGQVRGAVKVAGNSYNGGKGVGLDVTLNAPIAVISGVMPLSNAAASAEAKTLQSCRSLVARKDDSARASCFTPENPAMRSIKGSDTSGFWPTLTAYDPVFEMTDFKVTGGRTRGDWVELAVQGTASGSSSKGVVYLRRTPTGIKYSHSVIE